MKHRSWVTLSGFIWFLMGTYLLYKGIYLIANGRVIEGSLCYKLQGIKDINAEQASTILLLLGLSIGSLKGIFVLSKTVKRVTDRIYSLKLPIRFSQVYPITYWALIGLMMLFGMGLKQIPISMDLKGLIDVAIGSALMQGAMIYFRIARRQKLPPSA